MYILDIGNSIREAGRTIALTIFDTLLRLIAALYDLFNMIASHRLFDDNVIQTIYTRVGLVLGLFMVFRLTFSAIEYLINPDNITDKQKGIGNIIKKVLIVVILLGSVHFLFNTAYSFQDLLLNDENNVISKVILGNSKTTGMSSETDMSWAIFSSFFKSTGPETSTCSKYLDEDNSAGIRADFDSNYKTAFSTSSFKKAYECVNEKKGSGDWIINFEWFYGICTALFVGYVLCVYVIQLGVRSVQLAYLELIAPIPIMMYLNPKGDETLKKWGKQCLSTYLDVFIRVAILYFILLAFKAISEANLFTTGSIPVRIVLLIGLMMFAKKVPDLIKEIFPSTGGATALNFGLKMPDEAKKVGLFGAGAVLGATGSATSNALHSISNGVQGVKDATGRGNKWKAGLKGIGVGALSVVGGATSGFVKGTKIKNMRGIGETVRTTNSNRDKRDLKQAAGYKPWNAVGDKVLGFAGLDTKAEGMIKEAQWQQQAAEASRSAIWKGAEDNVKSGKLSYEDYSFARSLKQDKDESGNTIWRGLDKAGKEIIIKDADLQTQFAKRTTSGIDLTKEIRDNAAVDKRIKDEGKKIKGLEVANDSAKK